MMKVENKVQNKDRDIGVSDVGLARR